MQQTDLTTTELGTTGMRITRVGFGAWAIGGGGWEFGWGPQEDGESIAAIERALELGINWIDTAGRLRLRSLGGGRRPCDRRADAAALRLHEGVAGRGVGPPVAHNLKRRLDPARGRAAASSGSASRRSTCTRFTGRSPSEDIEEGWSTFAELKEQGLVRHIGVSNFDAAQLERIRQIAPVETLQPPYSLVERGAEQELLPYAERRMASG